MFHAEATFSIPTTASVEEADSPFMACVTLTTADGVMLDVDLVVELNTTDGTGLFQAGILFYDLTSLSPLRHVDGV